MYTLQAEENQEDMNHTEPVWTARRSLFQAVSASLHMEDTLVSKNYFCNLLLNLLKQVSIILVLRNPEFSTELHISTPSHSIY